MEYLLGGQQLNIQVTTRYGSIRIMFKLMRQNEEGSSVVLVKAGQSDD